MLKGLSEEDDEYSDSDDSGIDTRQYQDTKDMFNGNQKHFRKHLTINSWTNCRLSIYEGRYWNHFITTVQGDPGHTTRVPNKIASFKNGNNCCWMVYWKKG